MAEAPKKSKSKKHPKDMTSDEAIRHVFHPEIVKHLKSKVKELNLAPAKTE
jgi:hypothetical protein